MTTRATRAFLLGCTMLAAPVAHAYAADAQPAAGPPSGAAPAASEPMLGEVIVTARRRAENVQDVPAAVTALSGATLQRQGVSNTYDLVRTAPALNVNISAGGGQNQPQYTLRGQRQGDTPPSVDPSVGTYFGDIVMERPFGFAQQFFDLQNVQVLKGPQGTLFGRNTTGGAIIIQPNLPSNEFDAGVHGSLGNYALHEIDGYVNLPLNDRMSLRIAGQHTDRDGYIKDILTGQKDEDEHENAVRASLRIKPTDDIENVTVASYVKRHTDATGFRLSYLGGPGPAPAIYGAAGAAVLAGINALPWNETASNQPGFSRLKTYTLANTTTYAINDNITLKNIIGYVNYQAGFFDDVDGSPLPILGYGVDQNGKQFTEEFQILGKGHNYNWIAGAYYFRESAFYQSHTPDELNPVIIGALIPQIVSEQDVNYSKSVFASATYDFSDFIPHLSATAGGRYTWDTRNADFGTTYALGFAPGQATGNPVIPISPGQTCAFAGTGVPFDPATCRSPNRATYSKFTYNLDLDYKIDDHKMIYVAHRLGYRTGGFGTRATTSFGASFSPETVKDYEVGAKLDWDFDGMFLRTNIAAYHQDYSNIQRLVPVVLNGATTTSVQNAAKAKIDGVEGEFTFIPRPWLTISGFASQVQPKYDKFLILEPDGTTTDATKTAAFAGFPRTTFGVTARVTLPTPEDIGETVFQANYYHQSSYVAQDSAAQEPASRIAGYGLLNLRLEWNKVMRSNVDLALFANNVLDKHYDAMIFALGNEIGYSSKIAGAPAMFGIEASYHFR